MIFGITYGEHTTEYTEYKAKRTATPWRFENDAMIDIVENHLSDVEDNEYVGVFSHKFYRKTGLTKKQVYTILEKSNKPVINLSPNIRSGMTRFGTFMDWSDMGHVGIKGMVKVCCEHVGIEYNNDPEHIIYANQFVARKDIYIEYIESIIKPCLELLEGELWEQVNKPAGYTVGLPAEKLKHYTGLDFYNYVPFVLERMAMQWFTTKGYL